MRHNPSARQKVAPPGKLANGDWRHVEFLLNDAFYLLGVPTRDRAHGERCVISIHESEDGTRTAEYVFAIEALARLLAGL
jgi:hypothetical protein